MRITRTHTCAHPGMHAHMSIRSTLRARNCGIHNASFGMCSEYSVYFTVYGEWGGVPGEVGWWLLAVNDDAPLPLYVSD